MEWKLNYGTGNKAATTEKCEECGASKEDDPSVKSQVDPYMQEIHGDNTLHLLCDKCIHLACMEI